MVTNKRKQDPLPELMIGSEPIENASSIEYLGDIFNAKGTNSDMIKDRVKRGVAAMISIEAIMADLHLGSYTVGVYMMLYQSLFLSSMLFNAQAWSNLTEDDINSLEICQRKMLKKILGGSKSTTNSFTYLELGVLPISCKIHKRQLLFLHHILNLEDSDPVKEMYHNMKQLPGEKNWYNNVAKLRETYNISLTDDEIRNLSKDTFKRIVKSSIVETSFAELVNDCCSKKKTSNLTYNKLKLQDYLTKLLPWQSKLITRCRSKTLDIKSHQNFKYSDNLCRWCNIDEETLDHIVNCGEDPIESVDLENLENLDCQRIINITRFVYRVQEFLEKVDY
jgi:hypothetical protein